MRLRNRALAVFACAALAGAAVAKDQPAALPTAAEMSDAGRLVLDVDPNAKGVSVKRSLPVPNAAKKLFARYAKLADEIAPLTVLRGGDGKRTAWVVGKNGAGTALVFMNVNLTDETTEIVFRLSAREPMSPTYRRVLSKDGGRTWQTIAYEPPHQSISGCPPIMNEPYTLKVPGHCCQTVTIRLK